VAYCRFYLESSLSLDRQGLQVVANTHYAIENQSHPVVPPDIALQFEQLSDKSAALIGTGLPGPTSVPALSEIIEPALPSPTGSGSRTHATYAPDLGK
jgi:hypothetical protein